MNQISVILDKVDTVMSYLIFRLPCECVFSVLVFKIKDFLKSIFSHYLEAAFEGFDQILRKFEKKINRCIA